MNLSELWNYKHSEPILGIVLGDLGGSGSRDICAYTEEGKIIVLSLRGEVLFEDTISEKSILHAIIEDVNNDGKNELILGGTDGILRIFKVNRDPFKLEPVWAHQFGSLISGILVDIERVLFRVIKLWKKLWKNTRKQLIIQNP